MIGRLVGTVVAEEPDGTVTVDVGGVGYDVTTPVGSVGRAVQEAGRVTLHIHTHVREDAFELFGFASLDDRRVFRLLLRVPNVGPKTALGVLSALPIEDLAAAVREGSVVRLSKVPGIGKKTAERFVLELRGKLDELQLTPAGETGAVRVLPADARGTAERLEAALANMGFKPVDAQRVVKSLEDQLDVLPLGALIREACARLTA